MHFQFPPLFGHPVSRPVVSTGGAPHTVTMVFLFDSGVEFQESWDILAPSSEVAMQRLRAIAQARLMLLTSTASVVQLKVKGQPLQRVRWPGTGGTGAHARDALILRDEGRATKKHLRGVPREIYDRTALTPKGLTGFNEYNRTVKGCDCVLVRKGSEPEVVKRLEPWRMSLLSWKKAKKVTLRKLCSLLGADEAQVFWAAMKAQQDRVRSFPHPT